MQDDTLGTTGTAVGAGSAETDETDRLIASNKVEGTAVYNRQGEQPGLDLQLHGSFCIKVRNATRAVSWRGAFARVP